jgi:hypothetical protein
MIKIFLKVLVLSHVGTGLMAKTHHNESPEGNQPAFVMRLRLAPHNCGRLGGGRAISVGKNTYFRAKRCVTPSGE